MKNHTAKKSDAIAFIQCDVCAKPFRCSDETFFWYSPFYS